MNIWKTFQKQRKHYHHHLWPVEMSTATVFCPVRFWKIFLCTCRAAWLLNVSRVSAVNCVDVHLVMKSLQNEDFSEVIVLDNNSFLFLLQLLPAFSRCLWATIRRWNIAVNFLQVACCSHHSDALACELLIQNSGQLTGRHLTRKMLSGLQV